MEVVVETHVNTIEKFKGIKLFRNWYLVKLVYGWRFVKQCPRCGYLILPVADCYCAVSGGTKE